MNPLITSDAAQPNVGGSRFSGRLHVKLHLHNKQCIQDA